MYIFSNARDAIANKISVVWLLFKTSKIDSTGDAQLKKRA